MDLQALEPLVGAWTTEVRMPGGGEIVRGLATFAWLEGGGYLVARAVVDDPRFPNSVAVLGPEEGGDRIVQHYFDSRGVARVYDVSLDAGVLQLTRDDPDFAQRYVGRLSAAAITGAWERRDPGGGWQHDFELTFARVA